MLGFYFSMPPSFIPGEGVMKLKHIFEYVEMGEEIIAVPVSSKNDSLHGVVKLNYEGSEILKLLEKDTTEEEIVDVLALKYENDRETLREYVRSYIEKLREEDLIEE